MKLNLHFMEAHRYADLNYMQHHANELDEAGYKSVLHVFDSHTSNYFIKIARILNRQHNFKYLVALRTFTISPDFCATILKAFHEIQPNRVALNLLAGDLNTRVNKIEDKQVSFQGDDERIQDIEYRRKNVRWFAKKMKENTQLRGINIDFVFSGLSDYALETARLFDSPILVMIDDYFNNLKKFKDNSKVMVSARVLIRETETQAVKSLDDLVTRERERDFTICGSEEMVIKRFIELQNSGITDLLVHAFDNDNESVARLHKLAKKYKKM